MEQTKELLERIKEGIQEKKGKNIIVADLTKIPERSCDYFVICEGSTPTQTSAIYDSVEDMVRTKAHVKPTHTAGQQNAIWIAMDYVDVMVHIFLPEARQHYDIEHLWEDAELTKIPDID